MAGASGISDEGWFVYLIQNTEGRIYTGVTTDVARRLNEHNTSRLGAKATRRGRPWRLLACEEHPTKGAALRREAAIKRLRRDQKLTLATQKLGDSAGS